MANGDTLLVFVPENNTPTTANFATFDTVNQNTVLDFDASTNEVAVVSSVMPRSYGGNGLTVYLHYAMSAATSGDIDWDVAFERQADGSDITADSFAAVNSVDNTSVPTTAGIKDVVNVTFTDGADMDSIAVGEEFRMKVIRDAASDTATGDAELRKIELQEST